VLGQLHVGGGEHAPVGDVERELREQRLQLLRAGEAAAHAWATVPAAHAAAAAARAQCCGERATRGSSLAGGGIFAVATVARSGRQVTDVLDGKVRRASYRGRRRRWRRRHSISGSAAPAATVGGGGPQNRGRQGGLARAARAPHGDRQRRGQQALRVRQLRAHRAVHRAEVCRPRRRVREVCRQPPHRGHA